MSPRLKDEQISTDTKDSPPTKRKRLNLDLAPAAYELLQELSEESGKSMTEVLRTGLALYGIAQEEMKKGRSLAIAEGDKVIKEIVLP
ncbi:hypothetical protein HC928_05490 [bacterium]|nr:hypothetical protein [bacterium]